jgi:hypothetical protein
MIKVDECVRWPKLLMQLVPRNHFAGVFQQYRQDLKGLVLQLDSQPAFSELA